MQFSNFMFGLILISAISCGKGDQQMGVDSQYKQKMRDFVIGISQYAKKGKQNFLVIPQNGIELITTTGTNSGKPHIEYLNAIDANGQEDLFYGYNGDDVATPKMQNDYLTTLLNSSKNQGKVILVIDYCSTPSKMTNSYIENAKVGYKSFAADRRELDDIPSFPSPIFQENNMVIDKIFQIQNFLYLINLSKFSSKSEFIKAVTATNYDLLIMDLFFDDGTPFFADEIEQLKNKANGGKRIVVSYMSIGEAENYRYYWRQEWNQKRPAWLDAENPNWSGNFKVKYWDVEWQKIIYGNDDSYLKKIIDAHFDGVYLDIIDAFEYYE